MDMLPCMMLVFLLSAGASLAQPNERQLTDIVKEIRGQYRIDGQFCLAAVIPVNLNPNTFKQVFQDDSLHAVLGTIGKRSSDNNNRGVYVGQRVIVARPTLREGGRSGQHAERRVLQTLRERLDSQNPNNFQNSQGNFLLIYSFASACDTCTSHSHPSSIIPNLQHIVQTYTNSVFVFTKIFQPNNQPPISKDVLINSLRSLGGAIGGLTNIFRCDPKCSSCSVNQADEVLPYCITNNPETQLEEGNGRRNRGGGGRKRSRSSSSSRSVSRNRGGGRRRSRSRSVGRNRGGGRRRSSSSSSSRSVSRNRGGGRRNSRG